MFRIPHESTRSDAPRVEHKKDDVIFLDDIELEEKEYKDTFTKPIHDFVEEFVEKKQNNPRDLPELGGEPLELEDLKFMNVKALRFIYKDIGGEENVSKTTKQSLLKKIEWLRNQKMKTC